MEAVSSGASMMSPGQIHDYRNRTNKINMRAILWPTFCCSRCRQFRPNKGRKNVRGKWVCANCMEGAN